MIKSFVAPGKYIQGKDVLSQLGDYVDFMGKRFAVLLDETVMELLQEKMTAGLNGDENIQYILFHNESTEEEARRIASVVAANHCDVVIGVGGGKIIDTSKYVSFLTEKPLVIIPTIAASDAPCTGLSVVYRQDGSFKESIRLKRNPDLVLVDSQVIAEAPVRFLIAGIGDAFATYYEARACKASNSVNYTQGLRTEGAFSLAVACNDILLAHSEAAIRSVINREWSESLDQVIEAAIYLSGVGFENNGCAIAHAVYNGMTAAIKPFTPLHGEGVAYGVLVQLAAEYMAADRWNWEEWKNVIDFYKRVELPTSFQELGLEGVTDALLDEIASVTCTSGPNAHKMPFKVTPQVIKASLLRVEEMNENKKEEKR